MDGVLIVDKPQGITSADVVRVAKQRLRSKTGHLGTLDPFASGVLPLCLGEATKIAQFLNTANKTYAGVIRLGAETDTGDPTGSIIATAPIPEVSATRLEQVAAALCGESLQTPPMYSAIKRQGTPLYELARRGISVDRQPRPIRIDALELERVDEGRIALSVCCSKGTYVRVLAQQIAAGLGSVGHLEQLRRTAFGPFTIANAIALESLASAPVPLIGMRDSLRHLREIALDAAATERARQGYAPLLERIAPGGREEAAKLVGPDGELAAVIVTDSGGRWRFARVIAAGKRAAS